MLEVVLTIFSTLRKVELWGIVSSAIKVEKREAARKNTKMQVHIMNDTGKITNNNNTGPVTPKPVYAMYAQQRHRPICTSVQSDQSL